MSLILLRFLAEDKAKKRTQKLRNNLNILNWKGWGFGVISDGF